MTKTENRLASATTRNILQIGTESIRIFDGGAQKLLDTFGQGSARADRSHAASTQKLGSDFAARLQARRSIPISWHLQEWWRSAGIDRGRRPASSWHDSQKWANAD